MNGQDFFKPWINQKSTSFPFASCPIRCRVYGLGFRASRKRTTEHPISEHPIISARPGPTIERLISRHRAPKCPKVNARIQKTIAWYFG